MNLPALPRRRRDAHKGDFGKILVAGGSRAMPGAAALAATAALRAGAGLVKAAVPLSAVAPVAAHFPCYTFLPCPEDRDGFLAAAAAEAVLEEAARSDVLALGPGMGTAPGTGKAAREIVRRAEKPMVIDADGLNLLAGHLDAVMLRSAPTVLTPHPGEFARLDGARPPRDPAGRKAAAERLAEKAGCVVLLKGRGTVVTDGARTRVIETGNPGMATAGSGDVLTGMIAAFLAVLPSPLEAAVLGAHLHGLAGDLAAEELGETSLTAKDILDRLPAAIVRHQEETEQRDGP